MPAATAAAAPPDEPPGVSDGFVTLWERQRLDLTVETLVVDDRFSGLFTEEERGIARKRLADFGYGSTAA